MHFKIIAMPPNPQINAHASDKVSGRRAHCE